MSSPPSSGLAADVPEKKDRPIRGERLRLAGITKLYPSVRANDDISLTVAPGEIHALLGENGAGKSTLMKIVYGAVRADAGTIFWNGRETVIDSPATARRMGIGMVFQHFSLFETLTVGENIALTLGEEGKVALPVLNARIREVSAAYGLDLDPLRHVHHLSIGERQRVEIVRCLLQKPRLLIMDEPTSVLTPKAVRNLFEVLRRLASEGCSILYVSHKLDEIQALCTSATVMRGGRVTARLDPRVSSRAELARMMVGSDLPSYARKAPSYGEVLLNVDGLSVASEDPFGTSLDDIRFSLRAGQLLGIAGISGNGQSELFAALSGEAPLPRSAAADVIRIGAVACARQGIQARRALGLAAVPEERMGRGAVPAMSLAENSLLSGRRDGLLRKGWIRHGAVRDLAQRCIDTFNVRCSGPDALARSLSGGNLQRFIVGREILHAPRVLLISQPTWGVDVGAATMIRQQLLDLAARGVAILVISEELDELFEICDSIAVLARGRLSPVQPIGAVDAEQIGLAMSGLDSDLASPKNQPGIRPSSTVPPSKSR